MQSFASCAAVVVVVAAEKRTRAAATALVVVVVVVAVEVRRWSIRRFIVCAGSRVVVTHLTDFFFLWGFRCKR